MRSTFFFNAHDSNRDRSLSATQRGWRRSGFSLHVKGVTRYNRYTWQALPALPCPCHGAAGVRVTSPLSAW